MRYALWQHHSLKDVAERLCIAEFNDLRLVVAGGRYVALNCQELDLRINKAMNTFAPRRIPGDISEQRNLINHGNAVACTSAMISALNAADGACVERDERHGRAH
jgi:hypothetical protein